MRVVAARARQRDVRGERHELPLAQGEPGPAPHVAEEVSDRHLVQVGIERLLVQHQVLASHLLQHAHAALETSVVVGSRARFLLGRLLAFHCGLLGRKFVRGFFMARALASSMPSTWRAMRAWATMPAQRGGCTGCRIRLPLGAMSRAPPLARDMWTGSCDRFLCAIRRGRGSGSVIRASRSAWSCRARRAAAPTSSRA